MMLSLTNIIMFGVDSRQRKKELCPLGRPSGYCFLIRDVKEIIEGADGKLHCPGICDDTRAIVANLAVAKALIDSESNLLRYRYRGNRPRRRFRWNVRHEMDSGRSLKEPYCGDCFNRWAYSC